MSVISPLLLPAAPASRRPDTVPGALAELSRRRRAADPLALLTRRQRAVAVLAAHGATNDQIASRLFVTRRTVEFHLTGVFQRLGLRHRGQLAALVGGAGRGPEDAPPRKTRASGGRGPGGRAPRDRRG